MKAPLLKAKRRFFGLYEETLAELRSTEPQALIDLQHEASELRNSGLYSERVAGEVVHTACSQLLEIL